MKRVILILEDKEQGGVQLHCEPSVMEIANAVAEGTTRSDAYGAALFVTRITQLVFKGDRGIDELIEALKSARGDNSILLTGV